MDNQVMKDKDENGHVQISEKPMDVTEYMFLPSKNVNGSELNTSEDSNTEIDSGGVYNPFFKENDTKKHPVRENSMLSQIGPFADDRPICECEMVKQMTANPDVRYLLGLLPDMAEMNAEQKCVFKTRVLKILDETLMVES